MKVTSVTLLTVLLAPLAVSGRSLGFFDQSPIKAEGAIKVPGQNPLEFCSDPSKDLITIEKVDLSPNPPAAGQTLVITASGTIKEQISEGAFVNLEVKYGLITLVKQTVDFCEQIQNVDLQCPLEKGALSLKKSVDLPGAIPSGRYTVKADVYNADEKRITCLTALVSF